MKKRTICLLCMICLVEMAWCQLPWTGNKTLNGWDWGTRLHISAGDITAQVGDYVDVTISGDGWIDINGRYASVGTGTISLMVDEKIANELDDSWGGLNIRGNVTVTRVGYRKANKSRIISAGTGICYDNDEKLLSETPGNDPDAGETRTDMQDLQVGDRILVYYDNVMDGSTQSLKLNNQVISSSKYDYIYKVNENGQEVERKFTRHIIDVTYDNINQLKTNGLQYWGKKCQLLNAFVVGSTFTEYYGGDETVKIPAADNGTVVGTCYTAGQNGELTNSTSGEYIKMRTGNNGNTITISVNPGYVVTGIYIEGYSNNKSTTADRSITMTGVYVDDSQTNKIASGVVFPSGTEPTHVSANVTGFEASRIIVLTFDNSNIVSSEEDSAGKNKQLFAKIVLTYKKADASGTEVNNYNLNASNVDKLFTGPKKVNSGSYLSAEDKISFEPSTFSNYSIGDTLYVYTSNVKNYAEGFLRYKGQQANDFGGVNDGLVSKLGKYLVKGSYFQVLDAKMLEIIKRDGLDVGGKGHRVEYVVIRKGRVGINTPDDDANGNRFKQAPKKIAENVNNSTVTIPYSQLYNNGTYHAYWGDVIYVETDGTKGNTCTIKINDQELTKPLKCNDDFVMYLKFNDKQTLIDQDNAGKGITVTLNEGNIKNVYLVRETRVRNQGDLTAKGEVDWGRKLRVSVNDIGNLEVGDKIKIYGHSTSEWNSQFSLQILHYGEIDTKGLAYVGNHGYHDIYDRLTYDGTREYKEFKSDNYVEEYIVPTASMADAIRKNTFSVTGQHFYVDRMHVDSKTFVYPQTVGDLRYATMCAPYNIEMPYSDDLRAYAITGIQGKDLVLTKVQRIPMGAAVVLFKNVNVSEENFKLACFDNISLTEKEEEAFAKNLLIGDIVNKKVTNNDDYTYYMLAYKKPNDKPEKEVAFFRVEGTVTAGAYKSYLRLPNDKVPAGAKSFGFIFADEVGNTFDDPFQTTGIEQVEKDANDVYYNLSGQKTLHPTKGLYIRNNKKVIIK